jgi:translation initiation factor IF-2
VKVQELAKELNLGHKGMFGLLDRINLRIKSMSAKLTHAQVKKIKDGFAREQKRDNSEEEELEAKVVSLKEKIIKISDLIELFGISVPDMMKVFLTQGLMLNINSDVDQETAQEIGLHLNIDVKLEDTSTEEEIGLRTTVMEIEETALGDSDAVSERPPVVAIMGHVDHGKTQLLDTIRKANVVAKEAGGITQHIGAYQVDFDGKKITFLDTPGHEAFTSLRARGAQITDIVILVVGADEGVKPQTIEAINHALAADVPIIVALNKMDKPGADPEKVKTELSQHNVLSEDWGGKVSMVPLSAKTGDGIDDLLEIINLTAELLELKCSMSGLAKGIILESNLSSKKGPIATVLIKAGKLKVGDFFVVGPIQGKIRAMLNDMGESIKEAQPGMPVEILGLSTVPLPGLVLECTATEKEAKQLSTARKIEDKTMHQASQQNAVSLESLSTQVEEGQLRQLNLVIKADVFGSLEAIKASIAKVDSQDIPIRILHSSTGTVTENDVMLAQASNALVFGFGVPVNPDAKALAKKEGLTLKTYTIIYEIVDDIERVIKGLYKPVFEEVALGEAEVRDIFKFSKVSIIAGCVVNSGKLTRNAKVRIFRKGEEIHESTLDSLKRFKEDVRDVASGYECGIVINSFDSFEPGDLIQAYEIKEVKPI